MAVYGGLWESMDKYEYTSVYEYLSEFVHVSLFEFVRNRFCERAHQSVWGFLPYCFGKIAIVAGFGGHEHGKNYFTCRLVNLNTEVAKFATSVWRFLPHCVVKFTVVHSTNYKTVWKSIEVWNRIVAYFHTHSKNMDKCGENPQSARRQPNYHTKCGKNCHDILSVWSASFFHFFESSNARLNVPVGNRGEKSDRIFAALVCTI